MFTLLIIMRFFKMCKKQSLTQQIFTKSLISKANLNYFAYNNVEYGKKYLDNKDLQKGIIPKDVYVTRVNKVKGGHKLGKSIVLVDEGQDCHRDEKDILFSIFDSKNLAVANGGKEQG